jgi:hypothetical protein
MSLRAPITKASGAVIMDLSDAVTLGGYNSTTISLVSTIA